MLKLKYNDTFIYVDDSPLEENEMDTIIEDDDIKNTMRIKTISDKDLLDDTNIDMFGDESNE